MIAMTKATASRTRGDRPRPRRCLPRQCRRAHRQARPASTTRSKQASRTASARTIVTSHAAFQYLAKRYDLTQVPIAGIDPSNEPSPSQLGDITKLVRKEGITTIFTEELVSPAIADTIAQRDRSDDRYARPHRGPVRRHQGRDLPDAHGQEPRHPPEGQQLFMTTPLIARGVTVAIDGRPVLRQVDLEVGFR